MTENTTCGFGCHRFNLERQMSNGRLYNNVKPLHGRVNHRSTDCLWRPALVCRPTDLVRACEMIERPGGNLFYQFYPFVRYLASRCLKYYMPYRVPHILLHKTPQHVCCVDHGYIRDKSSSTGDSKTLCWTPQCWHMSYLCQNLTGRWGSVFWKNLFSAAVQGLTRQTANIMHNLSVGFNMISCRGKEVNKKKFTQKIY